MWKCIFFFVRTFIQAIIKLLSKTEISCSINVLSHDNICKHSETMYKYLFKQQLVWCDFGAICMRWQEGGQSGGRIDKVKDELEGAKVVLIFFFLSS